MAILVLPAKVLLCDVMPVSLICHRVEYSSNVHIRYTGMKDVLLTSRESSIPDTSEAGPIYICTRNDDLDAIIEKTPVSRREDLVFLQNGMLSPYLDKKGLIHNTVGNSRTVYCHIFGLPVSSYRNKKAIDPSFAPLNRRPSLFCDTKEGRGSC